MSKKTLYAGYTTFAPQINVMIGYTSFFPWTFPALTSETPLKIVCSPPSLTSWGMKLIFPLAKMVSNRR